MIRVDEKITQIVNRLAIENNITSEEALEIVNKYYDKIGDLVQSDSAFSIKLDFFGKIRTTMLKFNIKEYISFGLLKKRDETI